MGEAPDLIEPLIGWRTWKLSEERTRRGRRRARAGFGSSGGGAVLLSLNGEQWPRGAALEARCSRCGDDVPGEDCSCGIYAARTRAHLVSMRYHWFDLRDDDAVMILGRVALWGGVVPGELGWRAQYAYPQRLLVPHIAWRKAAELREAYGVPVRLENIFQESGW